MVCMHEQPLILQQLFISFGTTAASYTASCESYEKNDPTSDNNHKSQTQQNTEDQQGYGEI